MKGFIKINDNYETERYLAVDQIKTWGPDDNYHPNQCARIVLKDGTSIKTSWRHNVESIAEAVAEASQ